MCSSYAALRIASRTFCTRITSFRGLSSDTAHFFAVQQDLKDIPEFDLHRPQSSTASLK
jgi:hypothetical protein